MPNESLAIQLKRASAIRYVWSFIGLPYRWGGDDSILGFDCSGLVIEVLTGVGILPHGFDTTADGLYQRFKINEVAKGYAGCLCLWFTSRLATHVEMMIDDLHTIGASGGGSATTSEGAAAAQNAFVKLRPLGYRGQNYILVDPFKGVS